MLYAVKANKEVPIDEKDEQSFLSDGYDIYEQKNGKVSLKTTSPSKKVSYAKYEELEKENKELKEALKKAEKENKELKKAAGN